MFAIYLIYWRLLVVVQFGYSELKSVEFYLLNIMFHLGCRFFSWDASGLQSRSPSIWPAEVSVTLVCLRLFIKSTKLCNDLKKIFLNVTISKNSESEISMVSCEITLLTLVTSHLYIIHLF